VPEGTNCIAITKQAAGALLLSVTTFALAGCWTAPVANVQPKGQARLIQSAIAVVAVKDGATVQSVDADQRRVVLDFSDGTTATVTAGPDVKDFEKVRAGDRVRATVAQELSVYVLKNGLLPGVDGKSESIKSHAKVLTVEPSYRLLTVQYPSHRAETLKVGLDTKLQQMESGDDVVIETTQLLAVRVKNH
jgi:hypothetical protein